MSVDDAGIAAGRPDPAERPRWVAAASQTRLIVMLVGAVVAAVVTAMVGVDWGYVLLTGWDAAAAIFIGWVWLATAPMDSAQTASHATREDPNRTISDLIVLAASVASLVAVGFVLVRANAASGARQDVLAGLAVLSVALSWFSVHTLFTLRYARLYYLGPDGGIDFNQKIPPRYLDFAYLAFTIGMTFQVSDTNLQTPTIRATALRQGLLSYLFGAVILAAAINLIAGLGTG